MDNKEADANKLYLFYHLRSVFRYAPVLAGQLGSVADHSLLVTQIATMIAFKEKADAGKCALMATFHDIEEILTGDPTPYSKLYSKQDKNTAVKDMLKNTSMEEEMTFLLDEYEERTSLEARIVKCADIISNVIELRMGDAHGLKYPEIEEKRMQHKGDMREMRIENLNVPYALKLYQTVKNIGVYDWQKTIQNTLSEGTYGQ